MHVALLRPGGRGDLQHRRVPPSPANPHEAADLSAPSCRTCKAAAAPDRRIIFSLPTKGHINA